MSAKLRVQDKPIKSEANFLVQPATMPQAILIAGSRETQVSVTYTESKAIGNSRSKARPILQIHVLNELQDLRLVFCQIARNISLFGQIQL